jgi:hypothetical protein
VINQGLNQDWLAGATDLLGQPRIGNGIVDLGAYEIALTQPRVSCNLGGVALSVLAGDSTTTVCELWNSGVGTLYYSLSTNAAWLSVTPASGSSTGEHDAITVSANAAGLAPGNYAGLITFSSTNATYTQQTLPVTLSDSPNYNPALDTTGWSWTSSGNAQWTVQTSVTHDGVDAAQSGTITDNQQSALQTSVTGPGTLTFWWKVGSESGWDKLHFELGGTEKTNISGTVNWRMESFDVPAGPQTLRWTYTKDSSVSTLPDAGWLDQVVFLGPPQLLSPALHGTSFSLTVPTVTGKTYYLEYKNDLSDATWIALPLVAGDGTAKVLTDPGATMPRRFYHVRVQ